MRAIVLTLLAVTLAALPVAAGAKTYAVNLSLAKYAKVHHLIAGDYLGVSPAIVRAHVGDAVVFINIDSHYHTATGIVGAANFSTNPRWTDDALKSSTEIGPGPWSTGDLAPGARSAPMRLAKPGAYLYGCFYDYSAGMRGQIIVEP